MFLTLVLGRVLLNKMHKKKVNTIGLVKCDIVLEVTPHLDWLRFPPLPVEAHKTRRMEATPHLKVSSPVNEPSPPVVDRNPHGLASPPVIELPLVPSLKLANHKVCSLNLRSPREENFPLLLLHSEIRGLRGKGDLALVCWNRRQGRSERRRTLWP